jgi:hypothetical protein
MIQWWKKLFFHLFDPAFVNAHILHTKTSKKKILLEICNKKVTEGVPVWKFKYNVRLAVQLADS